MVNTTGQEPLQAVVGWTVDDTTITRKWYRDFPPNDGMYTPVHGMIEKEYYWLDNDRDVLFWIGQSWGRIDTTTSFAQWERVPDAMPDLVGNWVNDPDEAEGSKSSLTFDADGTVVFEYEFTHETDGTYLVTLNATGTFHPDTGFLTMKDGTWTSTNEVKSNETGSLEDGRMAIVPAVRGIAVSYYFNEENAGDNEGEPYGRYSYRLVRK